MKLRKERKQIQEEQQKIKIEIIEYRLGNRVFTEINLKSNIKFSGDIKVKHSQVFISAWYLSKVS